jgi:tetratricopeptide (TPR) repeat protein
MIYGSKKGNMINTNIYKMKTKLTLVLLIAFSFLTNAQSGDKCPEYLQYLVQFTKSKEYNDAYTYLQNMRKECPTHHKAIYIYGEFILKDKIDNAQTPEEKEALVKDLVALYGEHDKYFPGNGAGNTVKKAMLLLDNNIGTKQEAYGYLDTAFKTEPENFTSAKALYTYFELFVDDYEAGNKGIELQQVFDKYDEITEKLELEEKGLSDELDILLNKIETGEALTDKETRLKERNEYNLEQFSTVKGSMDAKIVLLSTCDKLIPFYQKSFEEKKTDVLWLKRAAERLEAKDCDSDPLFTKISEQLHKLNPTAESAYLLGVAAQRAKNTTKALEYFNQAAQLFTDATKKAKVYYKIATMYGTGNKTQARTYAKKALAAKPSFGQAYMLMAQLYASSANDCGKTPFEKRAVYWLSAQYASKAASVDPALKATANRQAASYNASAPSKTDIFNEGMAGKTISFNCWIGESVKVPNL